MRPLVLVVITLAGCRLGFDARVGSDATVPDSTVDSIPASCKTLSATCGTSGTGSCCTSPMIVGGTFARGFDVSGDGMYTNSGHPATLSSYQLDKYEVTVGRFRAFITAGGGTAASPPPGGAGVHPHLAGSGWDPTWSSSLLGSTTQLTQALACDATFATWTQAPGANENRPINCVTWYEAMAFCAWDGGFLPTEAEWEYAAAGGNEQRAYPWSSPPGSVTLDGTRASFGCTGNGTAGCQATDILDVGSRPAGDARWEHSDLAGNVWEWTLDYNANFTDPCVDCANLTPGVNPVIHGGSYDASATQVRTNFRGITLVRTDRGASQGVRCAR